MPGDKDYTPHQCENGPSGLVVAGQEYIRRNDIGSWNSV